VLVHAAFIVVYPSLFPSLDPSDADFFVPAGAPVVDGIEVMRVIEIDEVERADEPEEPEFRPVDEREVVITGAGVADGPVVDFARPGMTAADRLRPDISDRRLWAPIPREFTELSLRQREELALAGRLQDWYDSVQAAAEAEAALTDWSFTDGDGRRWGFADGKLYLGDYAVPMPSFAPPPGAARETAWRYAEVARQGQSAAVQQTVRERMEAIRARRDAERAAERARTQQTDSTATSR
jgi:hypothetical protein